MSTMSTQAMTEMMTSKAVHAINDCIEACFDGWRGYRAAALVALDPGIVGLLQSHSAVRAEFARALEVALVKHGSTPKDHGTIKGAAHRGFMELRFNLEGATDAVVLGECERGDLKTLSVYDRALVMAVPADLRALLVEQRGIIAKAYDDLVARDLEGRGASHAKPVSPTEAEIRKELDEALAAVEELADETRVKLHLASMDARTRWSTSIEPRLFEARQHAKEARASSKVAIADTMKALRAFADSL